MKFALTVSVLRVKALVHDNHRLITHYYHNNGLCDMKLDESYTFKIVKACCTILVLKCQFIRCTDA